MRSSKQADFSGRKIIRSEYIVLPEVERYSLN